MVRGSYHHGDLREALLSRAVDVLGSEGVDGLSLRGLARDLDVSHAAPARHFRDKQELLDAVAGRGFDQLNAALADVVSAERSARARFHGLGVAYVDFAVRYPALLETMYSRKHRPGAEGVLARARAGMAFIVDVIVDAQRSGEIDPGDADGRALAGFAALHGVASLAAEGLIPEGSAPGALVDEVVLLVWRGMGGDSPAD